MLLKHVNSGIIYFDFIYFEYIFTFQCLKPIIKILI